MPDIIVFAPFRGGHITNRFRYLQQLGYESGIVWPPEDNISGVQGLLKNFKFIWQLIQTRANVYHSHYASSKATILAFIFGKYPLYISVNPK